MCETNSTINSSAAVFGDVTSLTLATLPQANGTTIDVLLGATGSQLHVFLLPDCHHLLSQTVLPNAARCHGIATCSLPAGPQTPPVTLVAVHGDRHVNVFALDPLRVSNQLELVASLPRLISWTMAVSICPWQIINSNKTNAGNVLVTVGLSDNSVEFYKITSSKIDRLPKGEKEKKVSNGNGSGGGGGNSGDVELMKRVVCADRCLLYSMDIFIDTTTGVCYIAGGTIFLDVVVWTADFDFLSRKAEDCEDGDSTSSPVSFSSPVVYRLKGHEGSIHSVLWSPSGIVLASGSDDRTVRIWDIPEKKLLTESKEENFLSPRKVLYGHTARLWGFHFTQDESIVISCSEDRTCKFWNIGKHLQARGDDAKKDENNDSNSNFATLKAHRFRGVWHCCLHGSILYTGGADGAIKAWNLWDVLEPEYVERILKLKSKSVSKTSNLSFSSAGVDGVFGDGSSGSTLAVDDRKEENEVFYSSCPWMSTSLQCALPYPETTLVGAITIPPSEEMAAAEAVPVTVQEQAGSSLKKQSSKAQFDSSSEWVRCLAITKDHSTLFVATNRGLVHQVQLPVLLPAATAAEERVKRQDEVWVTIFKSERKRPLTAINVVEDDQGIVCIGLCDIFGYAIILTAQQRKQQQENGNGSGDDSGGDGSSAAAVSWSFQEWLPYNSDAVSGIHFLNIEGVFENNLDSSSLVFTTGPQGRLTLWQLHQEEEDSVSPAAAVGPIAAPLHLAESCCELKKSTQIVDIGTVLIARRDSTCENNSTTKWLVVAGTSCGAVVIWQLLLKMDKTETTDVLDSLNFQLHVLYCLKDVHLGSPIRSISLTDTSGGSGSGSGTIGANTIVLESCGSNGAIVRFSIKSTDGTLSIMVEEHYDALLIVAGKVVAAAAAGGGDGDESPSILPDKILPPLEPPLLPQPPQLVYGFQSTNFVVWDAQTEAEVCSIYCGSWRRPWAVQISASDVMTFCCDRGVGGTKISLYTRRPLVSLQEKCGGDNNSTSEISSGNIIDSKSSSGNCSGDGGGWRSSYRVVAPFPRALLPPGHGREVNAVAIRAFNNVSKRKEGDSHANSSNSNGSGDCKRKNKTCSTSGLFACFTGGEDSSIRQTKIDFSKNPSIREIDFISDHVGGTTVKALTMVDFFTSRSSAGDGSASLDDKEKKELKKKTLMITGGSKKVLMAWIVQEKCGTADGFECQLVSAHAVPGIISCKNLPSGKPSLAIEHRYLAISAIIVTPPSTSTSTSSSSPLTHAFIIAGGSHGVVELLTVPLDPGTGGPSTLAGTWQLVALLQYHTCPVISTQTVNLIFLKGDTNSSSNSSCYVAFTAATNGECAVWDLSSCIEAYLSFHHQHHQQQQEERKESRGDNLEPKTRTFLREEQGKKSNTWKTRILQPISVISGVHQSGINGMSAAHVFENNQNPSSSTGSSSSSPAVHAEVMIVTVGDDQGLTASLVKLTPFTPRSEGELSNAINKISLSSLEGAPPQPPSPPPPQLQLNCILSAQVKEPNAHSSAARDVWTDGKVAFSTGLDQKVRRWQLERNYEELDQGGAGGNSGNSSVSLSIQETGCVVTQVLEPASLDVAVVVDTTAIENGRGDGTAATAAAVAMKVAVAGRGLQVIEW